MRALLIPAFTLATTLAYGEPVVVAGLGTQPCTLLNAQTRLDLDRGQNGRTAATLSWVQGFVSAWNVVEIVRAGRFADLTSLTIDEQWSLIIEFCQKHPDGFVLDAAQSLIATGLKLKTAFPPNTTGDIDRPTKSP